MHHCQICGVVFEIKVSEMSNGDERPQKRQRPDSTKYDGIALRSVEAEGINDMQCVLEKIRANGPAPHNLHNFEFEKGSKTFLTGTCKPNPKEDHNHGHNYNTPHMFVPARYGVSTCDSSNVTAPGMPVHSNCFKIFQRVSKMKLGRIDIDGLYFLRNKQSDSNGFIGLDRGEDLKSCRQKDHWEHIPGTEYLAANPEKIEGLEHILSNCPVTYADYAFTLPGPIVPPKPADATDPFLRLRSSTDKDGNEIGQRIIDKIVQHIPDKNTVANLRLASRAFDKLPQSYFERVFTEEYSTCLWEMYDQKGKIHRQPQDWGTDDQTIDWHRFYIALRRMKGLKNRKRIWKDTNTICDRIRKMHAKEANKVGDYDSSATIEQLQISNKKADVYGEAMSVSA